MNRFFRLSPTDLLLPLAIAAVLISGCGKEECIMKEGDIKLSARTNGMIMQVCKSGEWVDFLIKGVNVGSAMPGKWFAEFPADYDLYMNWFDLIHEMNANTVRIYTLLDPVFYRALFDFNEKHKESPLMLLQEIWPADEIDENDLFNEGFYEEYRKEIALDIDALAGKANIPERQGRAYGNFNVSLLPYLLGIVIGREITTEEAKATNENHPEKISYEGKYVRAENANALEVWTAEMCDFTVEHAVEEHGWQIPVSFVSWPTLDPMTHPTELTPGGKKEDEVDDSQVLDPANLSNGPEMIAGLFGCYHIYPYYPEFMYREPSYENYTDEHGILRYGGYLAHFMSVHPDYPAVIGEFGLPTSLNTAHVHPEGQGHGAVCEEAQGFETIRMMNAIINEGYAGGIIFAWYDEWAKRSWITQPYMIPYARHIFWHNMMDPEQNFGLLAYEPANAPMSGNESLLWEAPVPPAIDYTPPPGKIAHMKADHNEAFLSVEVGFRDSFGKGLVPGSGGDYSLLMGIGTLGKGNGTVRMPAQGVPDTPGGMQFLLEINSQTGARLLARPDYNRTTSRFMAYPADDDLFVSMEMLTNRDQQAEDGTYFPVIFTDESVLNYGVFDVESPDYNSLGHWYVADNGNRLMIRLPWTILCISDPSSGTVIHDSRDDLPKGPSGLRWGFATDGLETAQTKGIDFYVVTRSSAALLDFQPSEDGISWSSADSYTWDKWDMPHYTARLKKSYFMIRDYFENL